MGEEYVELPLYGRAGTCCFYDIACYHTRLDGDGEKMRRTMQHYFSRGGWVEDAEPARVPAPPLTGWVLAPERLVEHPDPATRVYYSHFNTAMCEYKASGYDEQARSQGKFGDAAAIGFGPFRD